MSLVERICREALSYIIVKCPFCGRLRPVPCPHIEPTSSCWFKAMMYLTLHIRYYHPNVKDVPNIKSISKVVHTCEPTYHKCVEICLRIEQRVKIEHSFSYYNLS